MCWKPGDQEALTRPIKWAEPASSCQQPPGQGPFETDVKVVASQTPCIPQPSPGTAEDAPPSSHCCPGLAASRPWGTWAGFKRAETTNGLQLSLMSPLGEFGGKQNTVGLLITGWEGEVPWVHRLQFESQPGHCPRWTPCLPRSLSFPIYLLIIVLQIP